jgi:hypothetical protein
MHTSFLAIAVQQHRREFPDFLSNFPIVHGEIQRIAVVLPPETEGAEQMLEQIGRASCRERV